MSCTRLIAVGFFGLYVACYAASLPRQVSLRQQAVTSAPVGPFHVTGNRIIDSTGRPFLMRGTQLPAFNLETVDRDNQSGDVFGAHSATSLSAIRLRFNMNTVRLPVNVIESATPGYFPELAKVVRRANDLDLLVILAAETPGADQFWSRCAAYFKDYPNVMFDAFAPQSMQGVVATIRAAGARQPILAMSGNGDSLEGATLLADPNVIYEVSPRYATTHTDAQRDAHFGFLANRVPVVVNGWDLKLDDAAECAAIPSDPTAAAELVKANLDYADAHEISWTVSTFEPGKLIKDLSYHDATTLENGWTCGSKPASPFAGLGRVVEGHLRASEERELFVVSGSGGIEVARGGFALAYGPVMANRDSQSTGRPPTTLGGISIQITDALGTTRPAGMLWASEGWGQTNFVIPAESALGPARITVVRADGSTSRANITIAETAPGFVTGHSCRGPAVGTAIQVGRDGRTSSASLSACKGTQCSTIPVAVSRNATTRVKLLSSGFRNAGSAANIIVTIGGVRVPVLSFGPAGNRGEDQLTIQIPPALRGLGEADLICHVNGRVSNAVRIRLS